MSTHPEPRWRILAPTKVAQLAEQAEAWLAAFRNGQADAKDLFARFHPEPPAAAQAQLADARLALARACDYTDWQQFVRCVDLFNAICADDAAATANLLGKHPELVHTRVNGVSSNWGPALVCAVQTGSQSVFESLLQMPGQDLQWALDRAILKGRLKMARQLMAHGATPQLDTAMGPCETLNVQGLELLAELGAPISDEHGNDLAPVGLILEGYYRDPPAKHACLAFFADRGVSFPDTPVVALHRGRLDLLAAHLERDPGLPGRRFDYREIYPLELGCHEDETLGLHGTPLAGTTLLHMAVDFDELAIAEWLLDRGADPSAAARIDDDGFGGHSPLHGVVVSQAWRCGRQRDGVMARLLLQAGADPGLKASIRKGIRFVSDESVHEYPDMSAVEYGRAFRHREWVSTVAIDEILTIAPD